jgi:hypothetical protein
MVMGMNCFNVTAPVKTRKFEAMNEENQSIPSAPIIEAVVDQACLRAGVTLVAVPVVQLESFQFADW